ECEVASSRDRLRRRGVSRLKEKRRPKRSNRGRTEGDGDGVVDEEDGVDRRRVLANLIVFCGGRRLEE
ncbi:hypothetical protein LINPERHAP1_LOCUS21273, partial [Linum perenne]